MSCYYPLTGWRSRHPNSNGKYPITFTKSEGNSDQELSVPCGQCIGCRIDYSRQWAVRCMHEAQMYEQNCFITLTYSDENLPLLNGVPNLSKRDFQLFLKRLRERISPQKIKFYGCGEYGGTDYGSTLAERTINPHYHICIFGYDFPDKVHYKENPNGDKIYMSKLLDEIWGLGITTVGDVSFQSAAYVARYVMKKIKGPNWKDKYEVIDENTGEIFMRQPEFALMSRNPGIGKTWYEKYGKETLSTDSVIANGRETKIPRYYDNLLKSNSEKSYKILKTKRLTAIKKAISNYSLERLHVKAQIKAQAIKQLKKEL